MHTRRGDAAPVIWTGFSDGRYEVKPGPEREPGTSVTLIRATAPRSG